MNTKVEKAKRKAPPEESDFYYILMINKNSSPIYLCEIRVRK